MKSTLFLVLTLLACVTSAKPNPEQRLLILQELANEGLISKQELIRQSRALGPQPAQSNTASFGGSATISGAVTESGAPVVGAQIGLFDSNWGLINSTSTNASGAYSFTGIPAGDYLISAYNTADDYIDAIWTNTGTLNCQYCELPANAVITVSSSQVSLGHDLTLTIGATITGLLVDSNTGLEVDTMFINLYRPDGQYNNWHYSTELDGSGNYTITGVPAGQYRIYLQADHYLYTNHHIPELYNNIQCNMCVQQAVDGMGDLVNLVNGGTRSNVDFTLETGASISGNLVNNAGLAPLASYGLVYIFNVSNEVIAYHVVSGTDQDPMATGAYTIGGLLPGSYYAQGGDAGQAFFVRQLYNGINCPWSGCDRGAGGTAINLGANEQRTGINFLLQYGGKISGTVLDANTMMPINSDEQWIQVYDHTGAVVGGGYVDPATGNYTTARAIPAGTYSVRTGSMFHGSFTPNYVMEKYNTPNNIPCPGVSCDLTTVNVTVNNFNPASSPDPASDATTSGIDFNLTTGFGFSGTITDLSTLAPLSDVHVLVYNNTGLFAHWATTDINGDFTVSGLPAGTYYAKTNNGSNLPFMGIWPTSVGTWVDILYDNLNCPGSACDVTTGTPINLGPNQHEGVSGGTNHVFELPNGGTLSGRLINAMTTTGVTNTWVNVYNSQGEFYGGYATDDEGYWRSSGLPVDNYYLTTQGMGGLVDVVFGGGYCFDGACDPLTASPIPLNGQYNISNINMILKPDFIYKAGME